MFVVVVQLVEDGDDLVTLNRDFLIDQKGRADLFFQVGEGLRGLHGEKRGAVVVFLDLRYPSI